MYTHHESPPQDIVNGDDSPLPQQGQAQLVVAVVVLLKSQAFFQENG